MHISFFDWQILVGMDVLDQEGGGVFVLLSQLVFHSKKRKKKKKSDGCYIQTCSPMIDSEVLEQGIGKQQEAAIVSIVVGLTTRLIFL